MDTMETKLIDVQEVYKIYNEDEENEVRALDGVSLEIGRGEFVAIVGASGSGKSTLMNILGCLDVPTYGEYYLDGHDVTTLTDQELSRIRNREIGFIFQGYNLIPGLNAVENVELPLIYQGVRGDKRRDMAMEALERVGLEDRYDRRPSQLSGGQQQRIAVARAIAARTPIIMADEPTGALDSRTDDAGHRYTIDPAITIYTPTETTTYEKLWMDLRGGSVMILYYSDTGKVESAYCSIAAAQSAVIAKKLTTGGNPFASLLNGASDYKIYRDGQPARVSDIQKFDVGTYDAVGRVIQVSSAKVTGKYDNVEPNLQSPIKVTMLGMTFPKILPQAQAELARFKLGDRITLLLTADGQVAGARSADEVKTTNVGILEKSDGGQVEVRLFSGLTVKSTATNVSAKEGQVVTVSSGDLYSVYVSPVPGSNVSGSLDVQTGKVGTVALSAGCRIFDQAGGKLVEVSLDELDVATVPNSKITYAYRNNSGRIDALVLNDVTGDGYTYGKVTDGPPRTATDDDGEEYVISHTAKVFNHDNPKGTAEADWNGSLPGDGWGGIVVVQSGEESRVTAMVNLKPAKSVHRSAFTQRDGKTYVTLDGQKIQVAKNVQCYNRTTGQWMEGLDAARAFSEYLTVYYDRTAKEGGKVRVVMVQ